jgi:CHAT domain-containing protein
MVMPATSQTAGLSSATACLYGLSEAAILAAGYAPANGFHHRGKPQSFFYDVALDADWVILSACNTAAGSAEGAEALSGLARAFLYAGARALLVSHWAVASDATVKLITGAAGRMASGRGVGRAEAMRQSILALIDRGEAYEAHPAFWAPFVAVGEGGAGK